ncbi:MAG TPA: NAD(P)/FAD-dependent oxidoreductase [Xanthobacteraceae bacterium]|nr:NAD(P)/FAD-dependent oxidoreductase [Xanthobacteraceae bacterium]
MDTFDLVIIGTGVAAQTAAGRVRESGRSVAVVDHRPFGGTCALRGCDPKKVLVGAAETVDLVRRMRGHGVGGDVRLDWRELIAFKRGFTDPVPEDRARRFADQGIAALHGRARFVGRDAIEVNGHTLRGRAILIASGARPASLSFPGAELLATSEDFMTLAQMPERIVMVGGGYIAAEFSHVAARAGSRVTVLQQGERMLAHFDPDLVAFLMRGFREAGIDVRTRSVVSAVERDGKEYRVRTRAPEGHSEVVADLVVHTAGRVPDIDGLDLAAADVAMADGRIRLNDHLQSVSNPLVYAAGDAAEAGPPLTPVSSHDGRVVAANIIDGNRHRPDYRAVPSVAFTLPPIAAVGLSEAAARRENPNVQVKCADAADWYTARRMREPVYGYKTLVDPDTGRVLGAHLVGPHAEEVINLFALAIRHGITAQDLSNGIFAYPTATSDLGSMF